MRFTSEMNKNKAFERYCLVEKNRCFPVVVVAVVEGDNNHATVDSDVTFFVRNVRDIAATYDE